MLFFGGAGQRNNIQINGIKLNEFYEGTGNQDNGEFRSCAYNPPLKVTTGSLVVSNLSSAWGVIYS